MYNIESLSKLASLTKRTIRYYIEKGLVNPPMGTCRASYYTDEHLSRLEQIKKWSNQGIPLTQIKSILDGELPSVKFDIEYIITTHQWERLNIFEGIELHFRENYLQADELRKINDFVKDLIDSRCCKK